MLSYIPYSLQGNKEADYHIVFLIWLRLLGFEIEGEIVTNLGRIDAIWQFPGHTIIVEIKFKKENSEFPALLDAALTQIKEMRYAERYQDGRKISVVGIAFANNEVACRIENL
jgi:Holliday junction resolvase-like predicted endonuclease